MVKCIVCQMLVRWMIYIASIICNLQIGKLSFKGNNVRILLNVKSLLNSGSVGLGWDLTFCISNNLPGDTQYYCSQAISWVIKVYFSRVVQRVNDKNRYFSLLILIKISELFPTTCCHSKLTGELPKRNWT